jgi:hypothetical protein
MKTNRFHYTYKITFPNSGEFYYGKHSTVDIDDGSGQALFEKFQTNAPFKFDILELYDTEDLAFEAEKNLISDKWKTDEHCLNRVPGGKGSWSHISWKGIPKSDEHRIKISKGNSKPKEGIALVAAIQNARKGSNARKGMKDSDEVKQRRIESLRRATAGKPKPGLMALYEIDGVEYLGVKSIVTALSVSPYTIRIRVASPKWPTWILKRAAPKYEKNY